MNQSQIDEIKAAIRKEYQSRIRGLTMEMESALTALSRVEETLTGVGVSVHKPKPDTAKPQESLPLVPVTSAMRGDTKTPGAKTRIRAVLPKMVGEFTSKELWDAANNDGVGQDISRKSFYPAFSDLKKNNEITVSREQQGNQPGYYKKAEGIDPQSKIFDLQGNTIPE